VNTGKLCPAGWHVPTDGDWTILTTYLGGENVAGGKLKETDTGHWISPNTGATNETGFTALTGGTRNRPGIFNDISNYGFWWSSTEEDNTTAWDRRMYSDDRIVERNKHNKNEGFAVRCLRDF
jgi:uncharacterized protein (TIGR02145 family)